jgi:hypothetical protein
MATPGFGEQTCYPSDPSSRNPQLSPPCIQPDADKHHAVRPHSRQGGGSGAAEGRTEVQRCKPRVRDPNERGLLDEESRPGDPDSEGTPGSQRQQVEGSG